MCSLYSYEVLPIMVDTHTELWVGVTVQQSKHLWGHLHPDSGASSCPSISAFDPASCWNILEEAEGDALGSMPPMMKTWMEFLAPGLSLAQLWLFQAFSERASKQRFSLEHTCVLHSCSLSFRYMQSIILESKSI